MKRKVLNLLLTLALCLSLVPLTAVPVFATKASPATSLIVGGVTLDSSNPYAKTDGAGVVSLGGSESDYNIKFDASTSTLTLNNANIYGYYYDRSYEYAYGIWTKGDFTLLVNGDNTVTPSGAWAAHPNADVLGIASGANEQGVCITIGGNGTLQVGCNDENAGRYFDGISLSSYNGDRNGLTLKDSVSVSVRGAKCYSNTGVDVTGDIIIRDDANLTVFCNQACGSSIGVDCSFSLTVQDNAVLIAAGADSYTYSIEDSGTTYTRELSSSIGIKSSNMTVNGNATVASTGGKVVEGSGSEDGSYGIVVNANAFNINGGTVVANSKSTEGVSAALKRVPVLGSGVIAGGSVNADGSGAVPYDAADNATYKWFKTPYTHVATPYDLYIAGVQVTSDNASDLSVISGVSGKVEYDDATHTLTLENATLGGAGYPDWRYNNAVITIAKEDPGIKQLTIAFSGDNEIECEFDGTSGLPYYNGICGVYTDFIFEGDDDATLTISGRLVMTPTPENGALCCGSITLNGGTILCQAPEEECANPYDTNPYGVGMNNSSGVTLTVNSGKLISKAFRPLVADFTASKLADDTVLWGSVNYDGTGLEPYDFSSQKTYRYVEATPKINYAVTIGPGKYMSLKSGTESQTVAAGDAITEIVYTADEGYYFPADYETTPVNGISVTRNSDTQITVSGTPTANTTFYPADATAVMKVDAPTFTPASGTSFTESLDITISIPDNATVYYTTDKSDPSETNGIMTTGAAITLNETTTLKAIAISTDANYENSDVVTATYTKTSPAGGGGGGATTYPVTPAEAENGKITVSPKNAAEGDRVTITVTPDEGYKLDKLTVKDKDGNEIKAKDNGDGTFTIEMPASEIEVEATFKEAEETSGEDGFPFVDVPEEAYYREAVEWALEAGVTAGTSPTTFSPKSDCTRAQTVTFLWNASGKPEPTITECPFKDISESDYFYKAVLWAYENSITAGVSADKFGPEQTVTRGQVATFLYGIAGKPAAGDEPFEDVNEGDYFEGPVAWAYEEGITAGTGATTFSPTADCLREQIVTFLYKYFGAE